MRWFAVERGVNWASEWGCMGQLESRAIEGVVAPFSVADTALS